MDAQTTVTIWDSILHLVEDHGLSLVLLLFILFWLRPKIDVLWKNQIESKKRKEGESVENVVRFDIAAKSLLREALHEFHADWAALWQFHNGAYSIGRYHIPFMYLSITHEVHNIAFKAMAPHFKAVPTAMVDPRVLISFLKQQVVTHTCNTTRPKDELTGFSAIMCELHAKRGCIVPIRDEDGNLMALFSVAFSDEKHITEENLNLLQIFGRRMAWHMANMGEGVPPASVRGKNDNTDA